MQANVRIRLTTKFDAMPLTTGLILTESKRGAYSTYRVEEIDASGHVAQSAQLRDYPRWSEPAAGLVARAMNKVWTEIPEGSEFVERLERVQVEQFDGENGELVIGWLLRPRGTFGLLEVWDDVSRFDARPIELEPTRTWHELVMQGENYLAFAQSTLPPWPTQLEIPTHRMNDVVYIRLADVPEFARTEFLQYSENIPTLRVPIVGTCVAASVWEQFLSA